MASAEVEELSTDEETRGKLNSYRQIIADIDEQRTGLKESLFYNDGGMKAALAVKAKIEGRMKTLLDKARNEGQTHDEATLLDASIEGLRFAENQAAQVEQDFRNERMMIQGETRSLLVQAQRVQKLYQGAISEAERKKRAGELAEEDRAIRTDDDAAKKEEIKRQRSERAKKAAATRKRNAALRKQKKAAASDNT